MKSETIKLIYIGDEFYFKSGTMMSSIYTEKGQRSDWGFVNVALREGKNVSIRPATQVEMDRAYAQLGRILKKK